MILLNASERKSRQLSARGWRLCRSSVISGAEPPLFACDGISSLVAAPRLAVRRDPALGLLHVGLDMASAGPLLDFRPMASATCPQVDQSQPHTGKDSITHSHWRQVASCLGFRSRNDSRNARICGGHAIGNPHICQSPRRPLGLISSSTQRQSDQQVTSHHI